MPASATRARVVIIGAGFGGIGLGIKLKLAGLNALQQAAFKCPATFRTLGVNPAKRAIETGARLCESLLAAFLHQRQPQFSQTLGIIALLQFHVGKQYAVAAQAAVGTKL